MIKKNLVLILLILLALPLLNALTITDTKFSTTIANYTIEVDSMTLNKIIIENTEINFYNVSSPGTNITNINTTYNATINFYGLIVDLSVYNVNTSTYLFNSTIGNQDYNATFTANQTLRIVGVADTIAPTITLVSPAQGTMDTDGVIRFIFTPSDINTIDNCSLIYQGGIYTTSTSIANNVSNVIEIVGVNSEHVLFSDDLQWSINCTDEFNNVGNSETRNLDTKEIIGIPGSGGGEDISDKRNPKNFDVFYQEVWNRESKLEVIVKVFDKNNNLYKPKNIRLNYSILGIETRTQEYKDEIGNIITLRISNQTKLGNKTIEIIVEDERILRGDIEFLIDEKEEIKFLESTKTLGKRYKNLVKIVIGFGIILILLITVILILYDKHKKKKQ